VRYIPDLSESVYSVFQHIQSPGHKLESSYEGGLHIIFPELRTKANIGQHDIYLDVRPMNTTDNPLNPEYPTTLCRDITEFQQNVQEETDCLDNILHDLR
jgi:hypothetical protein